MSLSTAVFKLSDDATARISAECSAVMDRPLSRVGIDPVLLALKTLTISLVTIGWALDVSANMVGQWLSGRVPIPEPRKKQLIELLAFAIAETERSTESVRRLPACEERERLIGVLRGRISAAKAALPQEER